MTNNEETRTARLYSAKAPEKADSDRFVAFLRRKYGEGVELEWVEDRTMRNGFRLEVGTHVYDWSEKGLFKQFDAYLNKLRRTETASQPGHPADCGGAEGLDAGRAGRGDRRGDFRRGRDRDGVRAGERGLRGNPALRVGHPRHGAGTGPQPDRLHSVRRRRPRRAGKHRPAHRQNGRYARWARNSSGASSTRSETRWTGRAGFRTRNTVRSSPPRPSIIDRQSVNEPLETGILTIDSMFPIGKGRAS